MLFQIYLFNANFFYNLKGIPYHIDENSYLKKAQKTTDNKIVNLKDISL